MLSDENYEIIRSTIEQFSKTDPEKDLFNKESLYSIGEKVNIPGIGFRAVKLLKRFNRFIPAQLEEWYLSKTKELLLLYNKKVTDSLSAPIPEEMADVREKIIKVFTNAITPNAYAHLKSELEKVSVNHENWINRLQERGITPEKYVRFKDSVRFYDFFHGTQEGSDSDFNELKKRSGYLDQLEDTKNLMQGIAEEGAKNQFEQHRAYLMNLPTNLSEKDISAFNHIRYISDELKNNKYDPKTTALVLSMLSKMTSFGVRQETLQQHLELRSLAKEYQSAKTSEEAKRTDDSGHSRFVKGLEGQREAKVRVGASALGSEEREVFAYEVGHLLGDISVPASQFIPDRKTIQKYIANSTTLDDFLSQDNAASIIKNIHTPELHAYYLLGLIRSRGDGHGANTVIGSKQGGDAVLFDIDEEEDFLPYNLCEYETDKTEANEQSMCNMAALGFPQGAEPIPRVLLKLFSWEGIKEKTLTQLERRNLSRKRCKAAGERLDKIIEVCRFESEQKTPQVSPRDLYFLIFGKDYLYQQLKQQGCTDYLFFRVLVKHPDDKVSFTGGKISKEFDRNVHALDTPLDPTLPPMTSETKEQYPGAALLYSVREALKVKNSIDCLKIQPGAINKEKWESYIQRCKYAGRAPQNFMLSWCVQGFPRRIVRLLSDHYPECALSLVEEEDGTYLRIEKLPFILEAEKKMADMKKGSSIELIRFGKESYRKDLFDKEKPLREGRDPSDFVLYLSGQPRAIALWCMDTGSLLSIPKLELKTNEDGSFSIWYSK